MGKKILIILTNADKILSLDKPTGWFLPELAHPYKVLVDAGFTNIDVLSPKGGLTPMCPVSAEMFKDDHVCQWFLADKTAQDMVKNTKTPADVTASEYSAVLYPGGHGPMYDLVHNTTIANITSQIYENGGPVAAICHGPAALIPVKLPNGDCIVKGKKVTCFSNSEEAEVQLTDAMPFLLETKFKELGATYMAAADWQENVVVDGHLITGQNPASSTALGEQLVAQLK